MKRQTFVATYKGECYVKAYGRKLYKKGISLSDIALSGKVVAEKMTVSKTKAFDVLDISDNGEKITFDAVLTDDNKLTYINNLRKV